MGFTLRQINKIQNLKHKAILTVAFSVGLRVSEVCNLKIEDIDSKRMLIHIRNSKGNKDRYVPLSDNVLVLLRRYYKVYKPKKFLFCGQGGGKYSHNSCQKIFKKYIDRTKAFHNLRHSCFTNLIEKHVDLRHIQKLAGHKSSKTTEIYTHISKKSLNRLPLPI